MDRLIKYTVLKNKDIEKYLTPEEKTELETLCLKIDQGRAYDDKGSIECVVVENDWPMYEATWKAIEQWVDHQYTLPDAQT